MELIVLGSGAAFPASGENARNPAGYAVTVGSSVVLFDLGFRNLRQLARAGRLRLWGPRGLRAFVADLFVLECTMTDRSGAAARAPPDQGLPDQARPRSDAPCSIIGPWNAVRSRITNR